MKKLIFSILIILLFISSLALISCSEDNRFTTTYAGETTTETDVTTTEPPFSDAPTVPAVTYNVTYELNGGTNASTNPSTYKTGDEIRLSFPQKENYMFSGWYTDSAFTDKITEIKDKKENITLYAKWVHIGEVFYFNIDTVTIKTEYSGDMIVIPSKYGNRLVTGMKNAREINKSVKYIYVSQSISDIPPTAFNMNGVENEKISLEYIDVDPNNSYYKSVDGVLYTIDGKTLVQYPAGKKGDTYTVPEGVTKIGAFAFANCKNLKSIVIPNSVTVVEDAAFVGCTSLESMVIPDSVTELTCSFDGCTSLKSVTLSRNIKRIYISMFRNCTSLESVVIPEGVTSMGDFVFYGCTSLKNVVIPDSMKFMGKEIFYDCTSLKSIVIPRSVELLQDRVFNNPEITIYCEAESKPPVWSENWCNEECTVVWSYKA